MSELGFLWPMIVAWGAVVALGGIVSFYALRSGARERSRPMVLLGSGFVVLSAVTAGSWFAVYLTTENPFMASLGCAGIMAGGFSVIVLGLWVRTY